MWAFFFGPLVLIHSLSLRKVIVGDFDPPTNSSCSSSRILDWASKDLGATHIQVNYRKNLTISQFETIWKSCGMVPIIDIHASAMERERQAKHHHYPTPNLGEELTKFIKAGEKAGHPPSDLIWEAFMESDSAGAGFPWRLMQDAQDVWDQHLDEAFEETEPWTKLGISLWGRFGFTSFPHSLAERNVSTILLERANDDVGDILAGISFVRGAAKQFGVSTFGIDLSLWWGVIGGCVGDLGPLYHLRHLFALYAGGSSIVEIEGISCMFDEQGAPTVLGKTLVDFLKFARLHNDELGTPDVVLNVIIARDHGWLPPAAWATSTQQTSSWNYARQRVRAGGMRSLDAVFGFLFPGLGYAAFPWPFGKFKDEQHPPPSPCALTNVESEFAPNPWDEFHAEPPIPFGRFESRKDAKKFMRSGEEPHRETSRYRPMADTKYGSIVDVFIDSKIESGLNLNLNLNSYPVVVLAGPVSNNTEEFWDAISEYVHNGGILLAPVGSILPKYESLTGLEIGNEYRVGRAWRDIPGNEINFEPFSYVPSQVTPSNTNNEIEVIAEVVGGEKGYPLITKYVNSEWKKNNNGGGSGSGCVYTSLIPFFIGHPESGGNLLSGPAQLLFDRVLKPLLPSVVEGNLPVQWHTSSSFFAITAKDKNNNRKLESRCVTVLNNDEHEWRGEIRMRGFDNYYLSSKNIIKNNTLECRNVRSGGKLDFELEKGEVVVRDVRIDSFDVIVVVCKVL